MIISVEGDICRPLRDFLHASQKEYTMNRITSILPPVLILSGLLVAGSALAGHPDPDRMGAHGHFGAEHQLARLERTLDLSDEQSAELLPILQAADAERQALHQRVMEQLKPEICAQMQATREEILTVLTADQADEFDQLMSERKDRVQDRGRRGGMPDFNCDDLEG
jgi:Spy/CpxP family protein refolding chaperone